MADPNVTVSSDFSQTVVSVVVAAISAVSAWFIARGQNKVDHEKTKIDEKKLNTDRAAQENQAFQSLLKANESFREEVRRDLVSAKNEIADLKRELDVVCAESAKLQEENAGLYTERDTFQTKIKELETTIRSQQEKITELQSSLAKIKDKS